MAPVSRKRKNSNVRRRLTYGKKRRVTRRGRRSTAFSNQSGSGGGLKFKSRKTSRRAYKKHLWDSTLFKEHYRSVNAVTSNLNTSINPSAVSIVAESALINGSNQFYTTAGGAISPDAGNSMPTFNGDITIRGGMLGLRITNSIDAVAANQSTMQGTAFLIRTTKNWQVAAIPSLGSVGWDPTLVQDFDTKVGRILYRRNFLLKDADAAIIEYRVKIQKIDISDFTANYNSYVWLILAGNVDGASLHGLNYTKYWNLSFSADAV